MQNGRVLFSSFELVLVIREGIMRIFLSVIFLCVHYSQVAFEEENNSQIKIINCSTLNSTQLGGFIKKQLIIHRLEQRQGNIYLYSVWRGSSSFDGSHPGARVVKNIDNLECQTSFNNMICFDIENKKEVNVTFNASGGRIFNVTFLIDGEKFNFIPGVLDKLNSTDETKCQIN